MERARALRRRLRELTDRQIALGTVHARFFAETPAAPAPPPGEPGPTGAPPAPAVPAAAPAPRAEPVVIRAGPPPPKEEEIHAKLLPALRDRFPDGFTVGQLKDVLDELEGRAHTYDFAWGLANRLARSRVLEIAGTKPGPAAPIRIFRVGKAATEAS